MSRLDRILSGFVLEIEQEPGISFSIAGDAKNRRAVSDKLHAAGARISRSGPYTDREMHPTVDVNRFLFVGFLPAEESE